MICQLNGIPKERFTIQTISTEPVKLSRNIPLNANQTHNKRMQTDQQIATRFVGRYV